MRLGIRGKLFGVSAVVTLAMLAGSGLYLTRTLRINQVSLIESELRRHAEVLRELANHTTDASELAIQTRRFGQVSHLRTTLIDENGNVLADSDIAEADLHLLANHSDRPEVAAALDKGSGSAQRRSKTVKQDLAYVALEYQGPSGHGVVRVARPLADIESTVAGIRWLIVLAGGVGLIIAVVMSFLASYLMGRTLRSLVTSARTISHSEDQSQPNIESEEDLLGSVNQMAAEVEATVAELAKERALVKAVLKGMSEAVIALDKQRRVTLMNPAAVELLGLSSTPVGRSILEVLRVPALQQLVGDSPVTQKGSAEFELPNQRHVLAGLRPQRGSEGSVLVMHDVTDVRRLETVRRDFVANVSHELRTPVAIIRANAETLIDGALEDPKFSKSLVEALHRNAERLSNIIGDLLDLSRIEAGRYQVEIEAVDVRGIADSAAQGIERSSAAKDIEISVEVEDEVLVAADPKALEQVLFNLLDNAVKYTPNGGKIRICTELDGESRKIHLEDNGPGIEPRHRERVFERFYRVDPGRSRDMGGTGLGLAIVRHLVETMGGEVSVSGARPHGSVFTIVLPAITSD